MSNNNNNRNFSYKNIRLTAHAKQRGHERLGITKEKDLQKRAANSISSGSNLKVLYNIGRNRARAEHGINGEIYDYLMKRFRLESNSERIYYYKGDVYIFTGNGGKVLKTIIEVNEEEAHKWSSAGKKQVRRGMSNDRYW